MGSSNDNWRVVAFVGLRIKGWRTMQTSGTSVEMHAASEVDLCLSFSQSCDLDEVPESGCWQGKWSKSGGKLLRERS